MKAREEELAAIRLVASVGVLDATGPRFPRKIKNILKDCAAQKWIEGPPSGYSVTLVGESIISTTNDTNSPR